MTTPPVPATPAPLHHLQVKLALGFDAEHPARLATLVTAQDATVTLRHLDGTTDTVDVADQIRLARILERGDLCRLHGDPLVLVNTYFGVLGVATGPATPASRLEVLWVSRLENGAVVELLTDDDEQPGWQVLALA